MVRLRAFRRAVAALALTWAGVASAGPMGADVSPLFKTGDVEKDFNAKSSSVTVVPGRAIDYSAQPKWMWDEGRINGHVMKDIRLSYDKNSDTLAVGVNFWGVAGNLDGSPGGKTDPRTLAANGGIPNYANLGGDKSITVALAPVNPSGGPASALVIAGVPANKAGSPAGSLDGFKVASYLPSSSNSPFLGNSYGSTLTDHQGSLAYDPTQEHPDFEFTIKNFSKIPGLNALNKGFYISSYAGNGSQTIVGKSDIDWTLVGAPLTQRQDLNDPPFVTPPTPGISVPVPNVTTPEPTTFLAWGLVAGGAAWRVRRRIRPSARP